MIDYTYLIHLTHLIGVLVQTKKKKTFFATFCTTISCIFSLFQFFFTKKHLKSIFGLWSVQHPNAGQNIKHAPYYRSHELTWVLILCPTPILISTFSCPLSTFFCLLLKLTIFDAFVFNGKAKVIGFV